MGSKAMKFKEFVELTESLDSAVEWKWDTKGATRCDASFDIPNKKLNRDVHYVVSFGRLAGSPSWEVKLGLEGKFFGTMHYDTTKSGEEFTVYATALRIMLAFLKEKVPDNVIIVDKNDPRRLKLYGKMIDKFKTELSSLGYQAQPKDSAIHITKTGVKK
jgi:hypothetical protein